MGGQQDFTQIQNQLKNLRRLYTTPAHIKWAIIFFIGCVPLLVFWGIAGGNDGTNSMFNFNPSVFWTYGEQWFAAVCCIAFALIVTGLLVKFQKNVKTDVFPNLLGFQFIIINFWLFDIGNWVWLTFIFMYIAGYLLGSIIKFGVFIRTYQKRLSAFKKEFGVENLQEINPDYFFTYMNNVYNRNERNNNHNNQHKNKKSNVVNLEEDKDSNSFKVPDSEDKVNENDQELKLIESDNNNDKTEENKDLNNSENKNNKKNK